MAAEEAIVYTIPEKERFENDYRIQGHVFIYNTGISHPCFSHIEETVDELHAQRVLVTTIATWIFLWKGAMVDVARIRD